MRASRGITWALSHEVIKTDSRNVEGHRHLSAHQLVCICTVESEVFRCTL